MKIECPRCGSKTLKLLSSKGSVIEEYNCLGPCTLQPFPTHEHVYFQFNSKFKTYTWPATRMMYSCHETELQDVRDMKVKPEIF